MRQNLAILYVLDHELFCFNENKFLHKKEHYSILIWIIIGSHRRPETKQGIEGKIVRFRSGRLRDRDKVRDRVGVGDN